MQKGKNVFSIFKVYLCLHVKYSKKITCFYSCFLVWNIGKHRFFVTIHAEQNKKSALNDISFFPAVL